MTKRRRGSKTAGELMAELATDPEYQARRREQDRLHAERLAQSHAEQEELLRDLRSVGIELESVWDLAGRANDYQAAYPVLVDHLQRPYSNHVREGIARALTVPDATELAWRPLVDAFLGIESRTVVQLKFALGNALGALMDETLLPDVFSLVTDVAHGENRAALVLALGHFNDRDDVREVLESLTDDPYIAPEARQVLAKKRRARRKRSPRGTARS